MAKYPSSAYFFGMCAPVVCLFFGQASPRCDAISLNCIHIRVFGKVIELSAAFQTAYWCGVAVLDAVSADTGYAVQ